ncbi:MAG: undecaprenyl-diphosphate phosphatase [Bacteroidales bacterium]|nr:undecaprenyl-diphosphate phosphatase [Bacteroidales bacterium]
MGWWNALILGIIQGLTEFLPVSSSGHLEIAKFILGDESLPKDSLLMTIVLHAATALSTLFVFRKEIIEIIRGLFQFKWNDETIFSLKIVLSMIPAVFVGLYFNDFLESLFSGQLLLIGFMLLITAALLFYADRAKTSEKKVSYFDAVVIGISQAIAILPGISRSGATISMALILKIDRGQAARFSFLMVVPLILGEMSKNLIEGSINYESSVLFPLIVGFIAAFITGVLACTWMIKLVKNAKLSYFAIYCAIVGVFAISYMLFFA